MEELSAGAFLGQSNKSLNQRRESQRRLTSPISSVPIEILCTIFVHFLSEDGQNLPRNPSRPLVSLHSTSDPTILGQVCRHWRTVALDFPALWSSIVVCEPTKSQLYLTKLWIERSRGQPLDISFTDNEWTGRDDSLSPSREILSLFLSHSAAWKSVQFSVKTHQLGMMHYLMQHSAPCLGLESVSFSVQRSPLLSAHENALANQHLESTWGFFYSSPSLHRVELPRKTEGAFSQNTPYHQLTSFNMSFTLSTSDFIDILALFPAIQSVTASRLNGSSSPNCSNPTDHVFSTIHTLKIGVLDDAAPIFDSLTLPSLRTLGIWHRRRGPHSRAPQALQDFMKISGCSLKTFMLRDIFTEDGLLKTYLEIPELHSLTSLSIHRESISQDLVELFNSRQPDGLHRIMPSLEVLLLGSLEPFDKAASGLMHSRRRVTMGLYRPHLNDWE